MYTKHTVNKITNLQLGLSDNLLWINDFNVTLCRIGLVNYKKIL